MMDFAAAWDALAVGDQVQVSNGAPAPSNVNGLPYRIWRSHNFTGMLADKIDGPPRALKIDLPPEGGVRLAYTVAEGVGHSFTG